MVPQLKELQASINIGMGYVSYANTGAKHANILPDRLLTANTKEL